MTLSNVSLTRALIAAVILAVVGYGIYANQNGSLNKSKPYQAVFLTNGQVYFGKIATRTPSYTTLTDIYYLQVQQPIQPTSEQDKDKQQQTQIQLIKLGGELHKPKDEMMINNDQILFTEEIQADGQVGQAIDRHKKGETSTTTAPSQTQTQNQ